MPARIVAVPDIPRTISGKIVELAVREVVHGRPVRNTDALANPAALEHFRDLPELRELTADAARPDLRREYEAALERHGYAAGRGAAARGREAGRPRAAPAHARSRASAARLRACIGLRGESSRSGRRARTLPLGRRRSRQDLPDGPVPRARRRAGAARTLPPLHEGRARTAARAARRRRTRSTSWRRRWRATCACSASTSCSSPTSPTRCCSRACSRDWSTAASRWCSRRTRRRRNSTATACSAQRFLPAIALIERHTDVVNVDAGHDYRLRLLEKAPLYLDARADGAAQRLEQRFAELGDDDAARTRARSRSKAARSPYVAATDEVDLVRLRARSATVRGRRPTTSRSPATTTPSLVSDVPRIDAALGEPGAPLHRAGRRVLRPWRQAAADRRTPPPDALYAGERLQLRVRAHAQPSRRDADQGIPRATAPALRHASVAVHGAKSARQSAVPGWRARAANRYTRNHSRDGRRRVASPLIELERFLPYRISVLANVMSTAIAAAYEERFGLTIPEWRVIAVLSRYPGLSAREVAQKSRMDAVAVSRAVNRLLRAGRLRRAIARRRSPPLGAAGVGGRRRRLPRGRAAGARIRARAARVDLARPKAHNSTDCSAC